MAPAVALLIGWAVGERFGLLEFAAIVLTFAGITLLQIGQQRASGTLASTPGIVCSSLADAEE
jgi:drug/metabolite transporter (DMT)-like permease